MGGRREPAASQRSAQGRPALAALLVLAAAAALVILWPPSMQRLLGGGEPDVPIRTAKRLDLPGGWGSLDQAGVVARLTGAESVNRTLEQWSVGGTDLGHTFFHRGSLYMVFGDTYGEGRSDWRSNTMARISDPNPAGGLVFDEMISDEPGHAKELLSSRKIVGLERTVIPTNGVSLGDRMVLHYMSVRYFATPGRWNVGHSGLAYSDDDGQTWVKSGPMWGAGSNFAQVAFARINRDQGPVYVFGIPGGRFGGVKLARVPEDGMLDLSAYRYWDGEGWTDLEEEAADVVPGPVGELSVRWNAFLRKWLMLYLNERHQAVVVRSADQLTGPWSPEQVVVTARQYPQLYAPFMVPDEREGPELYFTLSRFDSYNVYLMQALLRR